MKKLFLALLLIPTLCYSQNNGKLKYEPYLNTLLESGKDPMVFVKDKMDRYPLLIFDDGLHTAADPFEFYRKIIEDTTVNKRLNYIFLEVVTSNSQRFIDSFLNADKEDLSLLFPAFQNDYATGFNYKTYFDLFDTVYQVNKGLTKEKRIKVVGVGFPVYWEGIKDKNDLQDFRNSLGDYDFHMYQIISSTMDNFTTSKRGIFLTNTRHAYKQIRDTQNNLYWNCNTFFTQWHPGKTYSIRIHNATLYIDAAKPPSSTASASASGTERFSYRFDRMSNGLWDYALRKYDKYPVAIDINNTPFGNDKYVGNLMLNVRPNEIMSNAYDAVIFLKPLEQMQQTAFINDIYTPAYVKELSRRYKILFTDEEIQQEMKGLNVQTLEDLIIKSHPVKPQQSLPQVLTLGSIEAWQSN